MEPEIIERLTRIETMLESLVGDGQPGRIGKLESQVEALTASHNRSIGIAITISSAIGAISSFFGYYVGHK